MGASKQTQQGSRQQSEELKSTQCFMSLRSKERTSWHRHVLLWWIAHSQLSDCGTVSSDHVKKLTVHCMLRKGQCPGLLAPPLPFLRELAFCHSEPMQLSAATTPLYSKGILWTSTRQRQNTALVSVIKSLTLQLADWTHRGAKQSLSPSGQIIKRKFHI